MDKISIKIMLGLYTKTEILNLILIRERFMLYNHRKEFNKENYYIFHSEIGNWWSKRYVNEMKKRFKIIL